MKKLIKKQCKHKWVFDISVSFKGYDSRGLEDYYRTVYHCEKCMQQDIQTIYR